MRVPSATYTRLRLLLQAADYHLQPTQATSLTLHLSASALIYIELIDEAAPAAVGSATPQPFHFPNVRRLATQ